MPYALKGSIDEELSFDMRRLFPEECGLSGVVNYRHAAKIASVCGALQVSRGEKGCGCISRRGKELFVEKKNGSVTVEFSGSRFTDDDFKTKLPGWWAMFHNRYSTAGNSGSLENIQPMIVRHSRFGWLAIAHNGTLIGHEKIRSRLMADGHARFDSSSDTEIILNLILNSSRKTIEGAIREALKKVPAAYSLLVMTEDKMFAIRDRHGIRPFAMAPIGDGFLLTSETFPLKKLRQNGFPVGKIDHIKPGEMIVFEEGKSGFKRVQYARASPSPCAFEFAYFSNPMSDYMGVPFWYFRRRCGRQIALENLNLKADIVSAIPDSGVYGAYGLAKALGVSNEILFHRSHDPMGGALRTFTNPDAGGRLKRVGWKLHAVDDPKPKVIPEDDPDFVTLSGKNIILVDDSIVRSNTVKRVVEMARQAGAAKVSIAVLYPPIISPCFYGMNFPTHEELIAYNFSIEEIRREAGVDELIYISQEGYKGLVKDLYGCGVCGACFHGKYPVQPKSV